MKINTIDLFSGIGGISLALQGYIETHLYCEIDTYCHKVLYERMKDGNLESAPIHADVNTLRLSKHMCVQAVIGGYPCQDISTIGNMKGITEDSRSGLFYQIMRITDENPEIKILFLENVANIISVGMKEVSEELVKREFQFKWLTKSASSLGAPHVRNRWFCLAYRGEIPDFLANFKKLEIFDEMFGMFGGDNQQWSIFREPEERISFKPDTGIEDASYDSNWIQRCQTLGNTVVPHVVRCAFEELAASAKHWIQVENIFGEAGEKVTAVEYPYPDSALVVNGKMYNLSKVKNSSSKPIHNINTDIMDPTGKLCKMLHFPTPRHGITHASSLTERAMHDLPTVLVNCEKSREYMEAKGLDIHKMEKSLHQVVIPNVNYIEWMMGYPRDWTKTSKTSAPKIKKQKEKEIKQDEKQNIIDPKPIKEKQRQKYNGMHAFMREQTGKDVRQVASMWRVLSEEEKLKYKQIAKTMV